MANRWRFHGRGLTALVLLGGVGVATAAARAAVWDDGNGNEAWHNATNWNPNTLPGSTEAVTFPTPIPNFLSTISLTGNGTTTFEVAGSLIFNASYRLQSGALELGSAGGSITTASSVTAEIDSILSGNVGLTKLGNGTLILGGANNYIGSILISAGTLSISNNGNLANTTNTITIQGGGILSTPGFALSRAVTIGTGGGEIDVTSGTMALSSGLASNANAFTSGGQGTLSLIHASSRTGTTTIKFGTVLMTNAAALGTGAITISNNGLLAIPDATVFGLPVSLGSTGGLSGAGGLGIFTGVCTVAASVNSVRLVGGGAGSTLRVGGSVQTNAYTGGSGTNTIVSGPGTVLVYTANDYAGDWQIDSGTLAFFNALALGTGTSPVVINSTGTMELQDVTFGRAITLNNGSTLALVDGTFITKPVTVASGAAVTLALRTNGFSQFPAILGFTANDLTGGAGGASITVTGVNPSPVLQLQQSSNYAGGWSISSFATVSVQQSSALGTGTSTISLTNGATANGGTLEVAGVTLARSVSMLNGSTLRGTGSAAVSGTVTFNLFGTVTLATAAAGDFFVLGDAANDYTGGTSGLSTTAVSGPGTVSLPFANNYAGDWSIGAGSTLRIGDAATLGTATSAVVVSGTLSIGGVTLDRALTLNSGAVLLGSGNFSSSNGTATVTAAASVTLTSLGGALAVGNAANDYTGGAGATTTVPLGGAVLLSFANNYQGNWTVSGFLKIQNATALGAGTTAVVVSGTLDIDSSTLDRALTLNTGAVLAGTGAASGSNGTATVASSAAVQLFTGDVAGQVFTIGNAANDLTGGGGGSTITVAGPGKLVLAQPSNYTGNWTLTGTLEIAADDRLGNAANTVTLSGGTLSTTASLSSARQLTVLGGGAVAPAAGTTLSWTGTIGGSGTLSQVGAGTFAITGTQSWLNGAAIAAKAGTTNIQSDPGSATAYNLAVSITPTTGNAALHFSSNLTGMHVRDLSVNPVGIGGAGLLVIDAAPAGSVGNAQTNFGAAVGSVAVFIFNGSGASGIAVRTTIENLWRSAALEGYWAKQNGLVGTITRGLTLAAGVVTDSSKNGLVVIPSVDEQGHVVTYVGEDIQGDDNGDGKVDVNDVGVVLQHLNTTPGTVGGEVGYTIYTPAEGDVNGDLKTDVNDLTVVLANLNQTYSPAASAGGAAPVPEPASLLLVGAGVLALLRRRRRPSRRIH